MYGQPYGFIGTSMLAYSKKVSPWRAADLRMMDMIDFKLRSVGNHLATGTPFIDDSGVCNLLYECLYRTHPSYTESFDMWQG